MYPMQSSTSTSLRLCLCLSAVVGIAQAALLTVPLPNNFVTPDASSCVAMNKMPDTLPQLASYFTLGSYPANSSQFQGTTYRYVVNGSYYVMMEVTVSETSRFTANSAVDFAFGNNTDPNAQWCLEDNSVTSTLASAATIRSQYERLLVNNLNLTVNVAFMYSITMVNAVDSTGNVFSAQMVLALDGASTVVGTIALSCSTANFGTSIYFHGYNPVPFWLAVTRSGLLESYADLNNFQCNTLGCCTGGFWYANLNTTKPQDSCPCARPTSTPNITTTTVGSMGVSSYRLTVFHHLVAVAGLALVSIWR